MGWIRKMAARHPDNQGALIQALKLTEAEVASVKFDDCAGGGEPPGTAQHTFATTFQAASLAEHSVREVLPATVMVHPNSVAKKIPSGYLTCARCLGQDLGATLLGPERGITRF